MATATMNPTSQPHRSPQPTDYANPAHGRRRHRTATKPFAMPTPQSARGPPTPEGPGNSEGKNDARARGYSGKERAPATGPPGNQCNSASPHTADFSHSRPSPDRSERQQRFGGNADHLSSASPHSHNYLLTAATLSSTNATSANNANMVPPHLVGKSLAPHQRCLYGLYDKEAKVPQLMSTKATTMQEASCDTTDSKPQATASAGTAGEAKTKAARITEKFTSLGVKVGAPEPASKAPHVIRSSTDAAAKLSSNTKVAAEPAPQEPAVAVAAAATGTTGAGAGAGANTSSKGVTTNVSQSRDTSKNASASPTSPKVKPAQSQITRGASRGAASSRGRGRGRDAGTSRAGGTPKQSKWLKNCEIPKADPKRWEIQWGEVSNQDKQDSKCSQDGKKNQDSKVIQDDEDNELEISDAGADGGWDDIDLTDSPDKWSPAPVHWDARPGFRDPHIKKTIDKWSDDVEESMTDINRNIPQSTITGKNGITQLYFAPDPDDLNLIIQGDLAPRYWVPDSIENQATSIFWSQYVASDSPGLVKECTLEGVEPWWQQYECFTSCVLQHTSYPADKGVDQREKEQERIAREADLGSLHHAESRIRLEVAKVEAQKKRQKKREERERKVAEALAAGANITSIKPGIKLAVRSAFSEDMNRVTQIYNHYVEHSINAPELKRLEDDEMEARFNKVRGWKLPFLVACERGGPVNSRKSKKNSEPMVIGDKVVGFAYALDTHSPQSMYRYTCNIEVFVDSAYYMKGIAKSLLDKMVSLLDTGYLSRGGYNAEGQDMDGTAPQRFVSSLIVKVPYSKEDTLVWKSRMLEEWLGFEKVGTVKGVGVKMDQIVSVATFQRQTGFTIDPKALPLMGEYPK